MMWYRKQGYQGQPVLEAYFRKKKTQGILNFLFKYNKRWFILDFNKWTLSYAPNKNKKISNIFAFKDIIEVTSNTSLEMMRMAVTDKKLKELK